MDDQQCDQLVEALDVAAEYLEYVAATEPRPQADAVRVLGVGIAMRCASAARAVALLDRARLLVDARAASRILVEAAIISRWIVSAPNVGERDRAQRLIVRGVLAFDEHVGWLREAHGFAPTDADVHRHERFMTEVRAAWGVGPKARRRGKRERQPDEWIGPPNLLQMAKESGSEYLALYNWAFTTLSHDVHCDPKAVAELALGAGSTSRADGLVSATYGAVRVVGACGALLERIDHVRVVDRLEALASVIAMVNASAPYPPGVVQHGAPETEPGNSTDRENE